jgi:hypothetical protein
MRKKDRISKAKDLKKKAESIRRRRNKLLSQVLRGESQKLTQKVAHILNQFPKTRESDITLSIYLLRTFYPDFIRNETISLNDLYKLPHFYDMQRERARIQNDYGLFQASRKIRELRLRHKTEEAERLAMKKPDFRPVFISTDESGKNGKYLIIGSL